MEDNAVCMSACLNLLHVLCNAPTSRFSLVSDEELTFGVWQGVRVKKGAAIRSRERSATICNLDRVLSHFGIQGPPAQLIVEFV